MATRSTKYRCVGIAEIAIGDVPSTGILTTTFITIANIVPDSARCIFDPPDITNLFVEDSDEIDVSILGRSVKRIEFATRDMNPLLFEDAFGGGTTSTNWSSATGAIAANYKQVRFTTKDINAFHLIVACLNVNIRAGVDLLFAKTDTGAINFAGDIMKPSTSTKMSAVSLRVVAE